MSHFSDKFMEISGKIGSQRHLVAIRDSFISMMPITMAGSVAVLLNVFYAIFQTIWDGQGLQKLCNLLSTSMAMFILGQLVSWRSFCLCFRLQFSCYA